MSRRNLILAVVPAPHGDLHVGHMAGPCLAADIYKRYSSQAGLRAHYVLEPAHRLGDEARIALASNLQAYSVGVDRVGERGPGYPAHIREFFQRLSEAQLLDVRPTRVLFEIKTGTYPVDTSVSGVCPACLDETSGGPCRSCGQFNAAIELFGLDPRRFALRTEPRLVLDLQRFRSVLESKLTRMGPHRPALASLMRRVLERPLSPFVLSHRGPRGLSLEAAELTGQRLCHWGEMYPAQMRYFEDAAGHVSSADAYTQFIGFEVAYVFTFVHVALAFAANRCGFDWPSPEAVFTSQRYRIGADLIEAGSQHSIWAQELTDEYNSDLVRLFLASAGPDYQDASFVYSVFERSASRIAQPIQRLIQQFNAQRTQASARFAAAGLGDSIRCMRERLPLADYASTTLAQRSLNCVSYFARRAENPASGFTAYIPSVIALCLEPFCPRYTDAIRARFPDAAQTWDAIAPCALDRDLPAFEVKADWNAADSGTLRNYVQAQ
jgi:methionyl-tRNA synthetase